MSLFSTWSVTARDHLNGLSANLSLSQTKEVLAAGLGHRSYASFKQSDQARLESAYLAVFSFEAMIQRAAMFTEALLPSQCSSAISNLNGQSSNRFPFAAVSDSFGSYARRAFEDSPPPSVGSNIASELGMNIFDRVFDISKHELHSLNDSESEVRWENECTLRLQSESADWTVQCTAEITFQKIGRHLLTRGICTRSEQLGPPVESGFDYISEGYVSESQD